MNKRVGRRALMISCSAVTCLAAGALLGFAIDRQRTETVEKNLARYGDHQQALRQAKTLLAELRKADWDYSRVDRRLLTLPDQRFAESRDMRSPTTFSFYPRLKAPEHEAVAFYSDLYVRKNLRVTRGSEGQTSPEGFLIVGWKDGRVEQVPIEDVRLLKNGTGEVGSRILVWPGLSAYDAGLPRYLSPASGPGGVSNAEGPPPAK